MPYRAQIDDHGVVTRYKDTDTGEVISPKEMQRRMMMQQGGTSYPAQTTGGTLQQVAPSPYPQVAPSALGGNTGLVPPPPATPVGGYGGYGGMPAPATAPNPYAPQAPNPYAPQAASSYPAPAGSPYQLPAQLAPQPAAPAPQISNGSFSNSPLIQKGAQMLNGGAAPADAAQLPGQAPGSDSGQPAGELGKSLRLEGNPGHTNTSTQGYKTHGFLDATSIAILLPTLVLLALIIAAAHKKRLFPWQTIRTFNPPSGLMTPRDYERSYICPPNLRRHGRLGKRNPTSTWMEGDGIVLPFGFLARTHLPITIPLGRLPNKNMFIVAPSGSGKTTLMRAVIKALLAKPCVIVALEAKANDPMLDEKRESFKHTVLPEAVTAGFDTLYFNPLDPESVHWNPLDLDPITFASSIVQDINSLPPEEQHWAERDHGYISGLTQLLKWGAFMVSGEDENGQAVDVQALGCNPRGLMRLVNNRRNIVESLRRCKTNPNVPPAELSEMTQTLSSIIRTDSDWDKNIQGVRGRLRMFKNPNVLRCTEASNIDIMESMHKATLLIFGAPASMGPDAESLASCFVYQLQNAMHSRYGTASPMPLFAFFDEYQTLNMDIAGRLSAIVRGANGGLTIILQNVSQIAQLEGATSSSGISPELKTIFSNSAIRVCLHNADESTAKFFSDEIGKHAIIVPGVSDHYDANGFGIFPTSWNRIHSQQVVARVDADSIKRMEKHHALVYLTPAGDPEFGELKPFMCDLRGIEEIARLHLLHNVAGRNGGAQGHLDGDGGGEGGIPGAPGGDQIPAAARVGSPLLSRIMSQPMMEKAANYLGVPGMPPANGQGSSAMGGPVAGAQQPQGAPMGQPGLPGVAAMAPGVAGMQPGAPVHGGMQAAAAAVAGAAIGATAAAMAAGAGRPPFPGSAPMQQAPGMAGANPMQAPGAPNPSAPVAPGVAQARPAAPVGAQAPAPVPMAPQPTGVPSSDRVCNKCGKWPGKGRFCIECGTFVGQPGAPAGQPASANAGQPSAAPGAQPMMAPQQGMGAQARPMAAPGQPMQAPGQTGPARAMAAPSQPVAPAQPGAPVQPGAAPPYAPSGPLGVPQRPPMTSIHQDLTKFGVPQQAAQPQQAVQPQQPAADAQPGQQPLRRPQPRGGGIEF